MNVPALLDRLDQVQPSGTGSWTARCPSHEDAHASLTVTLQPDRLLIHCHAGCTIGDVLTAINAEWCDIYRNLFLNKSTPDARRDGPVSIPKRGPLQSGRPDSRTDPPVGLPPESYVTFWARSVDAVAARLHELKGWTLPTLQSLQIGWDGGRVTIPVRDAEGRLLTVLRYLPGGTPKMLGLHGRGRHLFTAPDEFDDPFGHVWLVEGEPDAVSAYELDLRAVAVPGVATWKNDWHAGFQERRVTICMDCDEQGRACAIERMGDLTLHGVQARVVDLAPNRSDGFDLGDALAGATREGRINDLRAYLDRLQWEAWS